MSSGVFANKNTSTSGTRRAPTTNPDTYNTSQRTTNKRSLSDRIRNMFRKRSTSTNRPASNERRAPSASSPSPSRSSTDAAQLRAPAISLPFGKKKNKENTPTTLSPASKKKTKDTRKDRQSNATSMEISSPIYPSDNRTSIYGQNFVPRTPEFGYGGTGARSQSSSNYEVRTTSGFRDHMVINDTRQSQQVIGSDIDPYRSQPYLSDRNGSPSMNRQRPANTDMNYRYGYDRSPPSSMPLTDIEVLSTPQLTRRQNDYSMTNNQMVATKPPSLPQAPYRPSSVIQSPAMTTNSNQWRSTSTLNNADTRSRSSSKDPSSPKLNAPRSPFGSPSTKKKTKASKSKSPSKGATTSSTTVSGLIGENPLTPNQQQWGNTYGSLPDAEVMYGSTKSTAKPSKKANNKYPWISAIVEHHMRPGQTRYTELPPAAATTTTTSTYGRGQRFDTSTTTLDDYDQRHYRSEPMMNGPELTSLTISRHDGYIRPYTPQRPSAPSEVSIIRLGVNITAVPSPAPSSRPMPYETSDSPTTYRSSTTVYARDKTHHGDAGEIRTWSSPQTDLVEPYSSPYRKPYAHVEVERMQDQDVRRFDNQDTRRYEEHDTRRYDSQDTRRYEDHTVPASKPYAPTEHRYSPRAHEETPYRPAPTEHRYSPRPHEEAPYRPVPPATIVDEEDIQEEERYEVSYEYERKHEEYGYESRQYMSDSHSTNRYSADELDSRKNLTSGNLPSTARTSNLNDRDQGYPHLARSYMDTERRQEPFVPVAPVDYGKPGRRTYAVRRSATYDGLGILLATDAETRSNHFIRDVEPGSPGHHAGLRKNDRIVNINGIHVENVDFSQVLLLIKQGLDNDNLQISVVHESDSI